MKAKGWVTVRVRVEDLAIPPLATRKELRGAFMDAFRQIPLPPGVTGIEVIAADWEAASIAKPRRIIGEQQHRFGDSLVARTATHHHYNRTVHEIELLEGQWPDKDQLILWLGGIRGCGWGTAELGEVQGAVSIAGCD